MMRSALHVQLICLGLIAALSFAIARPVWAQGEEEIGGDYRDPTIVTDESTSDSATVPDGVKGLAKKADRQPIDGPIYQKWWFWATAVGVAAAWITFAVWPMHKKAPTCGAASYPVGCIGDGR